MPENFDLAQEIDKYLNSRPEQEKERTYFYISEVTKSKKEIYNSFKGKKKEKTEAKLHRIFDNGNEVHSRFYKYFAEMGILVAAEVDAVKNDLIHGRLDAIITDRQKNYVVDIKSMSQWSFQKLKDDPVYDHKIQLLMYMYYTNIPQGFILVECKDNQTIKTFYIELDEKNKKMIEKIIEELKVLKENYIDKGIEPEDKPIALEELQYD